MLRLVHEQFKNNMGKGENIANQHFLIFLQCFLRALSINVVKTLDFLVRGLTLYSTDTHFDASTT